VYGLTHPGKVRTENQDHFLISSLRKQMVIRLTSLPDTENFIAEDDPQRTPRVADRSCRHGEALAG
jgi:hypothetical protein